MKRALVFIAVLGTALAATVSFGMARERAGLPGAAKSVKAATVEAAALVSCFEGVQDDLFVGANGGRTDKSAADAARRLTLCDVEPVARAVTAINIPAAAPVMTESRRRAQADLDEATTRLGRLVLDARAAEAAMRADLSSAAAGEMVALAFRSVSSGYREASGLAAEAAALLRESRDN